MQRRIAVGLCTNGSSLTWRYTAHDGTLPMAEMEGGLMTRCFVRGAGIAEGTGDVIGEIIGTEESNAHPLFYFVNHRGDTMAAYVQHDTTKTLAAEYRYDAFGNLISSTTNEPAFLPRFTFSTKEYLAEAGLYLYAYRVYDPVAGRWTQRDPIDYQDSINLYQFCGNNPVNVVDSYGLEVEVCSRPVQGMWNAGDVMQHTWTKVTTNSVTTTNGVTVTNTVITTFSGTKEANGKLGVKKNDTNDGAKPLTQPVNKITVPPPKKPDGTTMTQAEWDAAVLNSGESETKKNDQRQYAPSGGDGGNKSGNSNTVTKEIITNAGGSIPAQAGATLGATLGLWDKKMEKK